MNLCRFDLMPLDGYYLVRKQEEVWSYGEERRRFRFLRQWDYCETWEADPDMATKFTRVDGHARVFALTMCEV